MTDTTATADAMSDEARTALLTIDCVYCGQVVSLYGGGVTTFCGCAGTSWSLSPTKATGSDADRAAEEARADARALYASLEPIANIAHRHAHHEQSWDGVTRTACYKAPCVGVTALLARLAARYGTEEEG